MSPLIASSSSLRLSRTFDPSDGTYLKAELVTVDRHLPAGAHPARRWAYALALHAVTRWKEAHAGRFGGEGFYDIGGHGSTFSAMLSDWLDDHEVFVVDPREPFGVTLEEWVTHSPNLADIVTCLGVLEWVRDLDRFCYHLSCLVAPGGLLVLTMDFAGRCGLGKAEVGLRERVFCRQSYRALRVRFAEHQLQPFGGLDVTYHGPHVDGVSSVVSLVLEKRL